MRWLLVILSLMAPVPGLAGAGPGNLSPALWSMTTRQQLERREAAMRPAVARIVKGSAGVSATMSPVAAHVGAETLRQGGTAADAAIATALTQVTMMTGANVSFAGTVALLYFDARTGRVHALDAGWNGWSAERDPLTIPAADLGMLTGVAPASPPGNAGRKTLVPGFMAGMAALHGRFGRLSWQRLFDPAIWYAENGVPVTPLLAAYFRLARTPLATTPEGRAFIMPDGASLPNAGERFVSPELATTLRAVARRGAREMYVGDWARRYVEAVRSRGGAASMADMASYRPTWTEPLATRFAGGRSYVPNAAGPSGCAIAMALNLIDHSKAGGRYWQDAAALRNMALIVRIANAAAYLPQVAALQRRLGGDAGCKGRVTAAFGAAAARDLDALAGIAPPQPAGHHTATVVAVDRRGNVAILVHTSNTLIWGDSGMVVGGVPIPVPAGLYQQRLAAIAPGGRLPTDMAPLMLLRAGRPHVAIATAGTSVVPESVRLMIGFARGEAMVDWLAAPPLLLNFEQAALPLGRQDELIPARSYTADLLDQLRALAFPVREVDDQRVSALRGTAAAARLGTSGGFEAAEVPAVLAFAEAQ